VMEGISLSPRERVRVRAAPAFCWRADVPVRRQSMRLYGDREIRPPGALPFPPGSGKCERAIMADEDGRAYSCGKRASLMLGYC
jgi:hypothetical protein